MLPVFVVCVEERQRVPMEENRQTDGAEEDRQTDGAASKPTKRYPCKICDKIVTNRARHMVAVHKVDIIKARGMRYDDLQTKRKKVQCPLCQRMIINLGRHLENVEKVARDSEQWEQLMKRTKRNGPEQEISCIPAQHPQRQVLEDFIKFRRTFQERSLNTIKKEMTSIMSCLLALNRSANLEVIFKIPDDDDSRASAIFMTMILIPMKTILQKEGNRVASSQYNKLLAFSTFLKWLSEAKHFFLQKNNLASEVQNLHTHVKAAMVQFRASKKMRAIAINTETRPMDIQNDFETKNLMTSLACEDTWSDKTKARDVLMTLLAVGSISRLGAIRNMTVEQLHNAKTVEEDENLYRIDVTTHKTMKIYGAAGIYLSKDLKPHLQRYLDERPAESPWVFCTSTGKQISSSHAAYVFRKMTHTTATQMRKSVAVAHRESPAEVQNAISEAMLHSLIVHKESYAGKTHHSTVYKGLRAVGAVQTLQVVEEEPGPSGLNQSSMDDQPGPSVNQSSMDDQPGPSQTPVSPPPASARKQSPAPVSKSMGTLLRFQKPLKPVCAEEWPQKYTREERVLRAVNAFLFFT
ncbi:uncharacterized protein LOC143278190 isoform X2 [Babylonia areolata]|uniref:uncharacterized protein LOC143278067 isoform X2 n=1 Tax=Babylonia areolata TaxID=304850 RepID=UPI003FD0638B